MGGKDDENPAPPEGTEHETRKDKLSKELEVIRTRRTGGSGRSFLAKKENFVLFGGIVYGGVYALMIFAMSSGMLGESTALDHAASNTFLDIGGECEEITEEPWIHMFPNEDLHVFSLAGHNLPEGFASLAFEITSTDEGQEGWSKANSTVSTVKFKGGSETGRSNYQADYSDLTEGHYSIHSKFQCTISPTSRVQASLKAVSKLTKPLSSKSLNQSKPLPSYRLLTTKRSRTFESPTQVPALAGASKIWETGATFSLALSLVEVEKRPCSPEALPASLHGGWLSHPSHYQRSPCL